MDIRRRSRRSVIFGPLVLGCIVVGLSLLGVACAVASEAPAASDPVSTILDDGSYARFYLALRKPAVSPRNRDATEGDAAATALLRPQVPYRSYPGIQELETPPALPGWNQPEFDDAAWPRGRLGASQPGSIAAAIFRPGIEFSAGVLYVRTRFAVSEPAALKELILDLKYRGGIAVYLNGREIARGHLPQGELDSATPGEPYPARAFVDAEGRPIPGRYQAQKRIAGGQQDLAERLTLRDRQLVSLRVPLAAVRPGVNVLAFQVHRSPYHPSALSWFNTQNLQRECGWVPLELSELRLRAAGSGAAPNRARPPGLQVWNHDPNDRVHVLDYGDPHEPLRPVRFIGVRNGAFSGEVVIGSSEAIRGLKASLGTFTAEDGRPATEITGQVRYPVLNGRAYQQPDWFDGLAESPPAEVAVHGGGGAVQPVWITVRVPREAKAGCYRAALRLSAAGTEVTVPIELHVSDFTLPDPQQFRTYVGVYQSPTSLALQYRVPEWSEAHWKLMEQSFALLAQIGNKLVNVPLSERTQFGNEEGMVYWLRQPDGSTDYDFTVLDRYLRLVKKHLGVPDFVVLHLWHSGGWESRGAEQRNTLTVLDKRSGARQSLQVPKFGTEESKRFWKPVLDAIRQRLAAEGMEQAMCLGILSDGTAEPEVFRAFDEIIPGGARWTRGCHTHTREQAPYPLRGGGKVVCHEYCYGMAMADLAQGLPPVWKQRCWPGVAFIRHNFDHTLSLLKYRTLTERSLYCGTRGVGRIGLDFWDVLEQKQGRRANLYNRWPESSCAQREPNLFCLAYPGPDGPAPTLRFEQLREGLQETEAMIVLAEAVGEHSARLRPALAEKCRRLLEERIRYCIASCPEAYGRIYFCTNHAGWQESSARLYAAAAEVRAVLGDR